MSTCIIVFIFIIVHGCPAYSAVYQCPGIARYSLSFYGSWSNMTHPNAFPVQGHFPPLIGRSHKDAYTMRDAGMKVSQGVKNVAETGNTVELEAKIMQQIMVTKTARRKIKASGFIGTSHVMGIDVEVFIGIMKKSLCNSATGMWMDSLNIDMLAPWDAETNDGTTFAAAVNIAAIPTGNIVLADDIQVIQFRGFILFVLSFISWYWNLFVKPRGEVCYICVALYLD